MPTSKYFTLPSDKLSEDVAKVVQPALTKRNIWNQKQVQSGKYRGLKICVSSDNASLINTIIKSAIAYVLLQQEKAKVLKQDTIPAPNQPVVSE